MKKRLQAKYHKTQGFGFFVFFCIPVYDGNIHFASYVFNGTVHPRGETELCVRVVSLDTSPWCVNAGIEDLFRPLRKCHSNSLPGS